MKPFLFLLLSPLLLLAEPLHIDFRNYADAAQFLRTWNPGAGHAPERGFQWQFLPGLGGEPGVVSLGVTDAFGGAEDRTMVLQKPAVDMHALDGANLDLLFHWLKDLPRGGPVLAQIGLAQTRDQDFRSQSDGAFLTGRLLRHPNGGFLLSIQHQPTAGAEAQTLTSARLPAAALPPDHWFRLRLRFAKSTPTRLRVELFLDDLGADGRQEPRHVAEFSAPALEPGPDLPADRETHIALRSLAGSDYIRFQSITLEPLP